VRVAAVWARFDDVCHSHRSVESFEAWPDDSSQASPCTNSTSTNTKTSWPGEKCFAPRAQVVITGQEHGTLVRRDVPVPQNHGSADRSVADSATARRLLNCQAARAKSRPQIRKNMSHR
jgi:hypothetical protein